MAVELRYSGGQNNQFGKGSLGGAMSDTAITSNVLHNLFDQITRTEALVGRTEYRCFYVYNTGPSHATGVTIEIKTNPTLTMLSIGLDPVGKGDGRNTGVATNITSEDQTPSGVKFFGEENQDDGAYDTVVLPIGLLRSGEGVAVWLKRKTEQGSTQEVSAQLDVVYDTIALPGKTFDDGGAIGELFRVTTQASGTFKIGSARIGFSDIG